MRAVTTLLFATWACSAPATAPGFRGASGGASGVGATAGTGSAAASGSSGAGASGTSGQSGAAGSAGTSGDSGSAGASAGAGSAGAAGAPDAGCTPWLPPACDAPPPDPGATRSWRDPLSIAIVLTGFANHRGRDLFLNAGEPQWIIGKFAYGALDKDLKGEDVDVWLLRDCGTTWENLGTTQTTQENAHATVEGVDDSGGRVYFQIPSDRALGLGRHRVRLVVAGDHTVTELFIEVVPQGQPLIVTDVDGTLTTTETEEFAALLTGVIPGARPDAPAVIQLFAQRGYRPFYLTARPEFLVGRTREFVGVHGFPAGIIHTTLELLGATGTAAVGYKRGELSRLATRGLVPAWGFGNSDTDAEAYALSAIAPANQRVFIQFDDALHMGRRIDAWTELLGEVGALRAACP